MADNNQTQLVLAQNQHAFIQDNTKGVVQVYTGPHSGAISQTERPVIYDRTKDAFIGTSLDGAIKQNPLVGEGEYLVLENPNLDKEGKPQAPGKGGNAPVELRIGSKINIPGPITFPLWPGQWAIVVPGHHLRSNQYLVVRVYNADEATKNATPLLRRTANLAMPEVGGPDPSIIHPFTPGQLLVIKGEDASFFIPPTGFEVLRDTESGGKGDYVREALTLERLEYAILLDEDGSKRYELGPQVVFPTATETFMTRAEAQEGVSSKSRKFKVIELNPQMGLYIKVIADYEEHVEATNDHPAGAVRHLTGEELFITGKDTPIYYPRPEHALIGYDDPTANFKRERYYGITIPKGEARYVLDKTVGDIKKVDGPQIFLPDPRFQVIVRRVLDAKTVNLWYPDNMEALAFNTQLAQVTGDPTGYVTDAAFSGVNATMDRSRGMNRMTASNVAASALTERMTRGTKFTPPPMLTLSSKYDGVPTVNVWTGYAVQVVDRSGGRRVVVGPATVLLQYDETLEMLTLSTGRPKNTDSLIHDVYLRVDNNLVSDEITVTTKDLVDVKIKLSYRVNFLKEHQERWFSVENYVKYLCDHMRSMLKARGKKTSLGELIDTSAELVRDVVLGTREEYVGEETGDRAAPSVTKVQRHRFFAENGMDVYDVEVLNVDIADGNIKATLLDAQKKAVQSAISLTANEQTLINMRRQVEIDKELVDMGQMHAQHVVRMSSETDAVKAEATMAVLEQELAKLARRREAEADEQLALDSVATATLARRKAEEEQELLLAKEHTALFEKRMAAITPNLIQAMQTLGETSFLSRMTDALAPLALAEQQGLGQTVDRVFKGTVLEPMLKNMQRRVTAHYGAVDDK